MKHLMTMACVSGSVLIGSGFAVQASPLTSTPAVPAVDHSSSVVKVHGFHRICRWGSRLGLHRNTPSGNVISCDHYYRPYSYGPSVEFRFGRDRHRRFDGDRRGEMRREGRGDGDRKGGDRKGGDRKGDGGQRGGKY
jgi:hypothetical protein